MTPAAAEHIRRARLKSWSNLQTKDNIAATPICLVSIRHEPDHLGQLAISVPDDLTLHELHTLLVKAAEQVKNEVVKGN